MSKHRHAKKRPGRVPGALTTLVALTARTRARVAPYARRLRWEYPRPARQGWRRWVLSWRQWLALGLYSLGGLLTVVGVAYANTDIPKDLNSFATQQDNVYYWADGTEMARTGQVNRQEMPLSQVPVPVQDAVVAAENESFWSDSGVSLKGISRAVVGMGDAGGGSTITQQYVKNAYLTQEQTVSRKITEMFIAVKLDGKMTKKQILQAYLNTSWMGRGSYGFQRAAQAYYGKDVSELNVSEGAFLASLLKGAGLYDPAVSTANHKRAVERWSWILDRMVDTGKLSAKERAKYTKFPEPEDPPQLEGMEGQTGYLVETAKAYISAHTDISDAEFALGGYQVRTTFEKPKVTALAKAANKALAKLDSDKKTADSHVRAGAASVATDGRILALYGGRDYLKQGFNDANSSIVPAGTSFTPFVYAAALSDGILKERGGARLEVSPRLVYNGDDEVQVTTPEGLYWGRDGKIATGHNDDERDWGNITLRESMAQSVNTPFIQLGMDVGLDRVADTATDSGFLAESLGARIPAFSLGNSTPSPIRMADAYATLAAGGLHTEPYSVTRVTKHGGTVFAQPSAVKPERAIGSRTAASVTDALQASVVYGAGKAAAAAGKGLAAKPGTTQDRMAGWFAGYDSKVSTAVAIFRVDPKKQELLPLRKSVMTDYPAKIWTEYLKATS